MADTIRVKRRVSPGAVGGPSSLQNAELAYNENDHTLYIGEGTGGAGGSATVVVPIGGGGMGSTATPLMDGTATPGTLTAFSRGDHVHPTDTSRAPLASPAFTGTPTAPTVAPPTDNTTKLATTAFVQSAVAAVSSGVTNITVQNGLSGGGSGNVTIGISPNGIANASLGAVPPHTYKGNNTGVSTTPFDVGAAQVLIDIGGAPLASPALTGTPTAPTAANGTNTTQIATTQFVMATRIDQLLPPNVDVPWNSHRITGLLDPAGAQDAATKNYVDSTAQGLATKQPVVCATTANISLSGTQTIDGVAVNIGDRVLVKDQTTQSQNGIWVVASSAWSRSTDANTWNQLVAAYTFVASGATQADNGYVCQAQAGGTIGVSPVIWAQFSGAGQIIAGAGLTKTGNQIDAGGTANRIIVNADNIDIAPNYAGQSSIITVGTITTGVWNGSPIGVGYGGMGATNLTGYLVGNGTNPVSAVATIPNTAITGLGTMAVQNANAVAITGGTIDGITFDGGTF